MQAERTQVRVILVTLLAAMFIALVGIGSIAPVMPIYACKSAVLHWVAGHIELQFSFLKLSKG